MNYSWVIRHEWNEIISQWDWEIENVRDEWEPDHSPTPVQLTPYLEPVESYRTGRGVAHRWDDERLALLRQMWELKWAPREMEAVLGIPAQKISTKLWRLGLEPHLHQGHGFWTPRVGAWLRFHQEQSDDDLAAFLGIHHSQVAKARRKFGIPAAPFVDRRVKVWTPERLALVEKLSETMSDSDIERKLDIGERTLWRVRQKYGLPARNTLVGRAPRTAPDRLRSPEFIAWLREQRYRTIAEIAEEVGCAPLTIIRVRNEFKLPRMKPGGMGTRGKVPGPRGHWRPEHLKWLSFHRDKSDAWIARKTKRSISAIYQVRRNTGLTYRETSTTSQSHL